MDNPLVLVIALPLAVGFLNLFLPTLLRKLLILAGIVLGLILIKGFFDVRPPDFELLGATALALDKLSLLALAFIQILSLIIFVFCLKGLETGTERSFLILYPLTVAFANGAVLCPNAFGFLVFWGLSGLTLYGFALLGRGENAASTAKKTFIIVGGSDAFLILGLALAGVTSGWSLVGTTVPMSSPAGVLAFVFLLIAAFAKAGGFPLHTWVPDFSRDAPVESAAFLPASLDKLLGIYLLTRMMSGYFDIGPFVRMVIVSLGALTIITAVMMAMVQHNGRRLLGYHAVSQVGYMIMGIASGSALAFAGGLFHLLNHTLYKSNLFLSLGSVEKRAGTSELDDLGGLARAMPLTFVMALIGALSISGIPPFNGFFSKWMIYQGLLEKASGLAPGYALWLLVCLVLAVFGSALTLASFMKFLHAVFLGQRPERLAGIKEAPANQWLATGTLAVLCVGFGLFAREIPLRMFVLPAAQEAGMAPAGFLGLYNPRFILLLFALAFVLGLIVFLLTRKTRHDEVYLGGNAQAEIFRVSGTAFYREITEMRPFKGIYRQAEKKMFDVYDLGAKATFGLSHLLQKAHAGLLQVYMLFILFGVLLFMILAR
ncbi:MAG: complex I subunit 5 family protein [Candidatus Aminicenantes bacterium]|nr:NADH dehydrogenase [Candidatus Aminicenantes bacterium]MCJ7486092.1 complex I subunit 5 family protein [Candidatus Aminicenantes bacterium]